MSTQDESMTADEIVASLESRYESLKKATENGQAFIAAGRRQLLTKPDAELESRLKALETIFLSHASAEGKALEIVSRAVLALASEEDSTASTSNN